MEFDPETERELRYRAKAVLRKRARALRGALPREAIAERSARIVTALAHHAHLLAAREVALFYPMESKNEVDLRPLDALLRERATRIAYPWIDPETRVMTFRFVDDLASLEERGLGFREPAADAPEATRLDVIVVPALQIDGRGHRLGYGAGFYDRTLVRFAPPAITIAVAFDFQLVPEVPITPGDVAVNLVVTDEQLLDPAHDDEDAPRRSRRLRDD